MRALLPVRWLTIVLCLFAWGCVAVAPDDDPPIDAADVVNFNPAEQDWLDCEQPVSEFSEPPERPPTLLTAAQVGVSFAAFGNAVTSIRRWWDDRLIEPTVRQQAAFDARLDAVPANAASEFSAYYRLGPIRHQWSRGLCASFAAAAVVEAASHTYGNTALDLSEEMIAHCSSRETASLCGSTRCGYQTAITLAVAKAFLAFDGPDVLGEATWPYDGSTRIDFPAAPARRYWNCPTIDHVVSVDTEAAIRARVHCSCEPVALSCPVYRTSWSYSGAINSSHQEQGLVTYPTAAELREGPIGWHAVALVGWDFRGRVQARQVNANGAANGLLEREFFLVRNSWGTASLGRNAPFNSVFRSPGHLWMSRRFVDDFCEAHHTGSDGTCGRAGVHDGRPACYE